MSLRCQCFNQHNTQPWINNLCLSNLGLKHLFLSSAISHWEHALPYLTSELEVFTFPLISYQWVVRQRADFKKHKEDLPHSLLSPPLSSWKQVCVDDSTLLEGSPGIKNSSATCWSSFPDSRNKKQQGGGPIPVDGIRYHMKSILCWLGRHFIADTNIR